MKSIIVQPLDRLRLERGLAQHSLRLLDNGRHAIPLVPASKLPASAGWNRYALYPPHEREVLRRDRTKPGASWGVVCGYCCVAVDNHNDMPEALR